VDDQIKPKVEVKQEVDPDDDILDFDSLRVSKKTNSSKSDPDKHLHNN